MLENLTDDNGLEKGEMWGFMEAQNGEDGYEDLEDVEVFKEAVARKKRTMKGKGKV